MEPLTDALTYFDDWLVESEWGPDFGDFFREFVSFIEEMTRRSIEVIFNRMSSDAISIFEAIVLEEYIAAQSSDLIVKDYKEESRTTPSPDHLRFLRAVGKSSLRVYEVQEVVPGSHVVLTDVFCPGESIRVREKTASKSLLKWDLFAGRVITLNRVKVFSTASILISRERLPALKEMYRTEYELIHKDFPKDVRNAPVAKAASAEYAADAVGRLAIAAWIHDLTPDPAQKPKLVNMDSDDIEVVAMAYPVKAEHSVIEKTLGTASDFEEDGPSKWVWIQKSKGQDYVHATLFYEGDRLLAECNSGKRAKRLTERLGQLFGQKLGKAIKLKSTLEREASLDQAPQSNLMESLDPEEQEELRGHLQELMRTQYLATIDDFVPMLGGVPRELVKTKSGREKVINWLKLLELSTLRAAQYLDVEFDFTILWHELGIIKYRT